MKVVLREVILKKAASFWKFPKRGGGVQPESKSFWVFFFGFLLDIFKRRGGGEPIPKVLE